MYLDVFLGIVSCFMAISQSEELRQIRHLVNFVDELTIFIFFLKTFVF